MKTPMIFGREPVVIVNGIEGLLACLIAFHTLDFLGLSGPDQLGAVMAVVSSALGIYIAYVTKDTLLGAATGFFKAGVAAAAIWGFDLTEQQTAAVITAMTLLFALWHRTQTGPAVAPSLDVRQHSLEIPPTGEVTNTVPVVNVSTGAVTEKGADEEHPTP